MLDSRFCPLRSTSNQKVECDSECMWYCEPENSFITCVIPTLLLSNDEIIQAIKKKESKKS